MAEWDTLRFALSERETAEAWAESIAVHEDDCPSAKAVVDATNGLIIAFRQWHHDRHGYAPTEHDFRLILDMARADTGHE